MSTTIAPPSDFVCPITMELMVFPMATKCGQNYEREAIMAWLAQGSGECPLTRKPLAIKDLIHNNYLMAEIQKWCELYNIPMRQATDADDRTMDEKLKHIYGTSIVPFKAVTPAPGYDEQRRSKKKRLSKRLDLSLAQIPTLRSPIKQRVLCALSPILRPKSLNASSFGATKC